MEQQNDNEQVPASEEQPIAAKPVSLDYSAIRPVQAANQRNANRQAARKIDEATLHCGRLVNQWFLFYQKNINNAEAVEKELERLDNAWKNWVRARSADYVYDKVMNFFMQKMMFLIGDKETNEQRLEKLKAELDKPKEDES